LLFRKLIIDHKKKGRKYNANITIITFIKLTLLKILSIPAESKMSHL